MRFPCSVDANGYATLVVVDAFGSANHGFTDGSAELFDAMLGLSGDATEVDARWCNDVTLNIKLACREGNGTRGVEANAINDNNFELTAAVNTAANVLTGDSSFVSSGLRFTTSGANFNVTLDAGRLVYLGRKYHVLASQLEAIDVEVDGSAAGTGDAFTLIASRDHYISIGPRADTDPLVVAAKSALFTITVQDVANGAAAPSSPSGEEIWAVLVTDGTGVTSVRYYPSAVIETDDSGGGLQIGDVPGLTTPFSTYMPDGTTAVLMPRVGGANLGALSTAAEPTQDNGGRFFGTIFGRGLWLRSGLAGSDVFDGRVFPVNRRTTTIAGATSNVSLVNLANLANASAVRVEITAVAYSSANQVFSRKISRCASKTSAGVMTLDGSDVTMGSDHDPGATGATVATTLSANVVRASVTGAIGHNFTWFVSAEVFLMGGI
jgi:hypothetical protein